MEPDEKPARGVEDRRPVRGASAPQPVVAELIADGDERARGCDGEARVRQEPGDHRGLDAVQSRPDARVAVDARRRAVQLEDGVIEPAAPELDHVEDVIRVVGLDARIDAGIDARVGRGFGVARGASEVNAHRARGVRR